MKGESECSYEGFCQFRRRTNEMETLIDFFRKYGTETGFRSAKSLISVGAGDGQLDLELLRHALPEMTSYTGIECDEQMYGHLTDAMSALQSVAKPWVKIKTLNRRVEDYDGPDHAADVVFMMHSLYYFGELRGAMIERALSWLTPGGRLVIGVVDEGNILQKLANMGKEKLESWVEKISSNLRDLDLSYTDYHVTHEFHPAGCDRNFASFVLKKTPVTDSEADEILSYLPTRCAPGTSYITHGTHIFVLTKQQVVHS